MDLGLSLFLKRPGSKEEAMWAWASPEHEVAWVKKKKKNLRDKDLGLSLFLKRLRHKEA